MRPTWALIDEAVKYGQIAEGLANSVAQRREGGDARLARSAADRFRRAASALALIEREDEDG